MLLIYNQRTMLILLLCILCNVVLAIIFKYFEKYQVDNLNAIVINYVVCVVFASVLIGQSSIPADLFSAAWWPYSVALSVLFISGFNLMAVSFQKCGVALTAIIQKMSLIIPASVAIAIYGEPLGLYKGIGMLLAIVAIILVNIPPKNSGEEFSFFKPIIIYPLIVFVLSGIIEVILFYVEVEGIVGDAGMQFTASGFGQAAVIGTIYSAVRYFRDRGPLPGKKELIGGIVLGLPNYLSIYLLVYLLSEGWQGSVLFPMNSIGILILSAIAGFTLYKEHLDGKKIVGVLLGVAAIILLSIA